MHKTGTVDYVRSCLFDLADAAQNEAVRAFGYLPGSSPRDVTALDHELRPRAVHDGTRGVIVRVAAPQNTKRNHPVQRGVMSSVRAVRARLATDLRGLRGRG